MRLLEEPELEDIKLITWDKIKDIVIFETDLGDVYIKHSISEFCKEWGLEYNK